MLGQKGVWGANAVVDPGTRRTGPKVKVYVGHVCKP